MCSLCECVCALSVCVRVCVCVCFMYLSMGEPGRLYVFDELLAKVGFEVLLPSGG